MKVKKFNEYVDNDIFTKIDVKQHIDIINEKFANCSDTGKVASHESYKKIIKNGIDSLPFLFEEMNGNYCMFWIIALESITGIETPDLKSKDMINFWIKWSKENGY